MHLAFTHATNFFEINLILISCDSPVSIPAKLGLHLVDHIDFDDLLDLTAPVKFC